MKRILFTAFLISNTLLLVAQSNAAIQFSIDKTAIDLLQRKTYSEFLQHRESALLEKAGANAAIVRRIYEQPLTIGLDTSQTLSGFVEILPEIAHIGVQIPLSDVALFERTLLQYARNNLLNMQPIDSNIENEQIRTTLMEQRAQLKARRQALFAFQEVASTNIKLIDQGDLIIAWSSTQVFVIKSIWRNTQERINSSNSTAAEVYDMLQQEMNLLQQKYAAQLTPIMWQEVSHDVVIRLDATAAIALNETVEKEESSALLSLLFDKIIQLEETTHQIQIDLEQEQILVQLTQADEERERKNWTKAALTEKWEDIEWEASEDALDVWFRVLGKRLRD